MVRGRAALVATVAAVVAYFAWTAAAADEFDGPSVWTVLAAGAFWLAVVVLLLYLGGRILRMLRPDR